MQSGSVGWQIWDESSILLGLIQAKTERFTRASHLSDIIFVITDIVASSELPVGVEGSSLR